MDVLRLTHLALLFLWAGVIAGETVIEAIAWDPAGQPFAAKAHFWIDVCIELPLVGGVLVTGILLTRQVWPLTPRHYLMVVPALLAIAANLYCAVLVGRRYARRDDPVALARLSTSVRWTWTAVPVGLFALGVGLVYFS